MWISSTIGICPVFKEAIQSSELMYVDANDAVDEVREEVACGAGSLWKIGSMADASHR